MRIFMGNHFGFFSVNVVSFIAKIVFKMNARHTWTPSWWLGRIPAAPCQGIIWMWTSLISETALSCSNHPTTSIALPRITKNVFLNWKKTWKFTEKLSYTITLACSVFSLSLWSFDIPVFHCTQERRCAFLANYRRLWQSWTSTATNFKRLSIIVFLSTNLRSRISVCLKKLIFFRSAPQSLPERSRWMQLPYKEPRKAVIKLAPKFVCFKFDSCGASSEHDIRVVEEGFKLEWKPWSIGPYKNILRWKQASVPWWIVPFILYAVHTAKSPQQLVNKLDIAALDLTSHVFSPDPSWFDRWSELTKADSHKLSEAKGIVWSYIIPTFHFEHHETRLSNET